MADYGASINSIDFLYRRNVHFVSPYSEFKSTIIAKLTLNDSNFNFELAKDDGSDFRLVDGINTLRMWVAHWSKTSRSAILFFKLQNVSAGVSLSYKAYWGNEDALSASEPDKLGVDFYESFSSSNLDTSKWSGDTSSTHTGYGYLIYSDFSTITNPLYGKTSWVMEAGLYGDWDTDGGWDSADRTTGFTFSGPENGFSINIMHSDRIEYNAVAPEQSSWSTATKTHGGLEGRSINDVYISYYEPEDKITIRFLNRNNFSDIEYNINRKVEGDTRPNNVQVLPRQSSSGADGAYPTYISWLIIRDYDSTSTGELDGSELYIEHEEIPPQSQDFREYGLDLTNTFYEHESSFGGDPYLLSNDIHDSDTNVWISDDGATSEDSVSITINLGWSANQLVSRYYTHYDSGHVYYYNASKLSSELDRMGRNYWWATTTSGWAAIKFDTPKNIGALRVKFREEEDELIGAPKDFAFYGSTTYPGLNLENAKLLVEGTFEETSSWQSLKIPKGNAYRYFILDVLNTYDGENIRLQDWRMYSDLGRQEKIYPSQFRLHPAIYGDYIDNFPKEIMFEGSEDGINWTTLIPWTYTYTPYSEKYAGYGLWQRYSFDNIKGFWSFRLSCRGNWAADDGRIIIGEWSLHELAVEDYFYRVLSGTTNNIQQIWASNNRTFEDIHGTIYIANEKLSFIVEDRLVGVKDLPEDYGDLNVA